ncbi:sugar phosphate isomerase/epimerase family protein [Diplocloster hominis]|uniref:sugar phosphate isomerase/epimerase family protein n=1 Tax=Diplocloster hominis TaxID=3079010 RepID=UPI0031BADC1D
MASKIKYSAIIGSLGQTSDRFMKCGYKDPKVDQVEFPDVIKSLEQMQVLSGADLYQAPSGPYADPEVVNEILTGSNLVASSVLPQVFGERKYQKGSIAAADPAVRKEAMDLCKQNIDFNARLVGSPSVNLWLGQDGFDYPLQTDYTKQWDYLIGNVRELADYNPDIKLTLEGKIREPRNRCLIDTTMTALLVCMEVDRPNVGVAIDTGHVFQAQQSVAQNIEVAARYHKLFMIHANDNYNLWDDDMMVGALRLTEFIEMFYALRKADYDGFISVDIFPYRENQYEATRQSVLNMQKYDEAIDRIGFERLGGLIDEGNPCEMTKVIRENLFQ